ncbi:hypothetical protein Tco_1341738 [Tanacetum coccineum]
MLMEESNDELKDIAGDDEVFEAGEEMEDAFPPLADEETQHPPLTEQPSTESQPAEPTSTEHQSPSPNKVHLESSKEKQHKESDQSPDASNSKSLLCSNTNYSEIEYSELRRHFSSLRESDVCCSSYTLLTDTTSGRVFGPKSIECTSVLHQPDGVGSEVRSIANTRQLNGIMVVLIA